MSDLRKVLLVIKAEQVLKPEQRVAVLAEANVLAERLGAEVMIADGGLDAGLHSDIAPLLERQIELQQETNQLLEANSQLLEALVMALGEEADPDAPPLTYMDGTPVG
ncbi:hypothetical protein [Pseudomonas abyssi]|uniref:Uncharacterized protein n=1 Tax=Pseudomonas abyssi TaxID=170540 RepID=A0A395RAJ1_9PSED|nr:hypothetical protein [Halopseudomonas gallaeciensis]RGP57063.1 hypothetical protein ASB58_06950 [Halopseudomonas gallaeciensis]